MRILEIFTEKMRNAKDIQLKKEFRDLVIDTGAEELKIKPQFDEFEMIFKETEAAFGNVVKSALTKMIKDANKSCDEMFGSMVEITNAYTKHFDPAIKKAADNIQMLFQTHGNISRLPIKQQMAKAAKIITSLNGIYKEDCEKIGLTDWCNRMKADYDMLTRLARERDDEIAARTGFTVRQLRKKLDESFKKICEIINVYVILEGPEKYELFIKRLNATISRFNISRNPSKSEDEEEELGEDDTTKEEDKPIVEEKPIVEDKYPNAREWHDDLFSETVNNGDIFYIVRNDNKIYYKVKDNSHVDMVPDGEEGEYGWELAE